MSEVEDLSIENTALNGSHVSPLESPDMGTHKSVTERYLNSSREEPNGFDTVADAQQSKVTHPQRSRSPDHLYHDAEAHRERMQNMMQKTPEGCTFKPDTHVTSSHRSQRESHTPVSRRLYEEAANRKARQQDISSRPPADCPFKPTLVTTSSSVAASSQRARASTPTRLYESARHKGEKIDKLRKQIEQEQLAECTFHPTIAKGKQQGRSASAGRGVYSSTQSSLSDGKRFDRLYMDASKKEERLAAKAEQLRKEEQQRIEREREDRIRRGIPEYGIKEKQKFEVTGSFEERCRAADNRISSKMKAKKDELANKELQECTFKPQLKARPPSPGRPVSRSNSKQSMGSDGQSPAPRSSTPVHLRLSQQAEELKKRKDALKERIEAEQKARLPFKPTLVSTPSRPTAHSYTQDRNGTPASGGKDIYERLNQSASEYKKKRELVRERILAEEREELTFSPTLCSSPSSPRRRVAPHSPPSSNTETGSVFDRLSQAAVLRKEAAEKAKPVDDPELTFTPVLNKRAKSAPKRRKPEEAHVPVHDRLIKAGERRKTVMIENAKARAKQELEGCTFNPSIPKESELLVLQSSLEESFDDYATSYPLMSDDASLPEDGQVERTKALDLSRATSGDIRRVGESQTLRQSLDSDLHSVTSSRRSSSAGRSRKGSIFERLSKQPLRQMSVTSVDTFDDASTAPTEPGSTAAAKKSTASATKRESLLMKPTLASQLKSKSSDYEALVTATAEQIGALPPPPVPVLDTSFAARSAVIESSVGEDGSVSPNRPRRKGNMHMTHTASSAVRDKAAAGGSSSAYSSPKKGKAASGAPKELFHASKVIPRKVKSESNNTGTAASSVAPPVPPDSDMEKAIAAAVSTANQAGTKDADINAIIQSAIATYMNSKEEQPARPVQCEEGQPVQTVNGEEGQSVQSIGGEDSEGQKDTPSTDTKKQHGKVGPSIQEEVGEGQLYSICTPHFSNSSAISGTVSLQVIPEEMGSDGTPSLTSTPVASGGTPSLATPTPITSDIDTSCAVENDSDIFEGQSDNNKGSMHTDSSSPHKSASIAAKDSSSADKPDGTTSARAAILALQRSLAAGIDVIQGNGGSSSGPSDHPREVVTQTSPAASVLFTPLNENERSSRAEEGSPEKLKESLVNDGSESNVGPRERLDNLADTGNVVSEEGSREKSVNLTDSVDIADDSGERDHVAQECSGLSEERTDNRFESFDNSKATDAVVREPEEGRNAFNSDEGNDATEFGTAVNSSHTSTNEAVRAPNIDSSVVDNVFG